MLDIRLLRDQPDFVKARLALRSPDLPELVNTALREDSERRAAETQLQELQSQRNRLSKETGKIRSQGGNSAAIEAQVKAFAAEMEVLAERAHAADARLREVMLILPNLPQQDVPEGADASDNPVLRTWGEPSPGRGEDHVAIGTRLGLFDLERAAKISGSGFICYTGKGARLERALINFLLDLHTREHGYEEVSPPFLVRRESMVGTGQLPKFEEDLYAASDDLFLVPTAEVPVTNLHREEILDALPKRYAAYTPCFRREAGSTGRDTRGMIRMHQFDKVELVKICHPDSSAAELESLTLDAERVLQRLGLAYRVICLCTGDMGFGSAKTYDIEVWAPGQQSFLEVSSCSNFEDFQARRMNLRFKDENKKNRFCHTLNGSGTALARLYVALIEHCLQPDGSLLLPETLHAYFGAERIS